MPTIEERVAALEAFIGPPNGWLKLGEELGQKLSELVTRVARIEAILSAEGLIK